MNILGISSYYHDSSAVLLRDGILIAAAQEERFTRKKHDSSFPAHAILYCLGEGAVSKNGVDVVVYYDKPITKFTRLLTTYAATAPGGLRSFLAAVPVWLKEKAWLGLTTERFLHREGFGRPKGHYFSEHHYSHARVHSIPLHSNARQHSLPMGLVNGHVLLSG